MELNLKTGVRPCKRLGLFLRARPLGRCLLRQIIVKERAQRGVGEIRLLSDGEVGRDLICLPFGSLTIAMAERRAPRLKRLSSRSARSPPEPHGSQKIRPNWSFPNLTVGDPANVA